MEDIDNTEDFLARWASGELSSAEKEAFAQQKDHKLYEAILEGTAALEVPAFNKQALYDKVQQQKHKNGRLIDLVPKWAYAVAAAVALLLGFVWFGNNTQQFSTGFGEQLAVNLPDGSAVQLNAQAQLSYKDQDWAQGDRKLNLKGNAFFKVQKGSKFVVSTPNGAVTVLGTQFTVNSQDGFLEVICFEGRVKVNAAQIAKELTAGQAMRLQNGVVEDWETTKPSPDWLGGESSFNNAPLYQVIKALEDQYGISINATDVDVNQRFTGSFTHADQNIALRTVLESMQIKMTTQKNGQIMLYQ